MTANSHETETAMDYESANHGAWTQELECYMPLAGSLDSPSARFLIDVHISSNDLAQFFHINYFPLSELNHLHEMETRAASGGPAMACACSLSIKWRKLPDVPAGGSVPYSRKVLEVVPEWYLFSLWVTRRWVRRGRGCWRPPGAGAAEQHG